MKKQILKLGKNLNKREQQEIKGGRAFYSCEDFCWFASRDGAQYHLDYQSRMFGLGWYHCTC